MASQLNPVSFQLFFTLVFLIPLLISPTTTSGTDSLTRVQLWCDRTPYPDTCKYHMSTQLSTRPFPLEENQLREMTVQIAMDRVVRAQSHHLLLSRKNKKHHLRTKRARAAWADCVELHESTVRQLNRTLGHLAAGDAAESTRTLLSAALTNLETCRDGFAQLNATESLRPALLSNASLLISNSLAVLSELPVAEPVLSSHWAQHGEQQQQFFLEASSAGNINADLVVAKDGSGNYTSVKEAVEAASKMESKGSRGFVIYVKTGVYEERVVTKMANLVLVGDGMGSTVITGKSSVGGGSTTYNSATFAVTGTGFMARDITFRNTAGPKKHQAVAMRSNSDLSVFHRCSFEGHQDTLYAHSMRQFYKECDIYGTVDFIFGNAAVVFQDCNIYVRKPMSQQKNTITAQGRTDLNQNTGISIHNCRVTAAPEFIRPVQGWFRTFLGRPWKEYSRTVFLQTYLDGLVDPSGWLEWDGSFALGTLYYGEYRNTGPGSATARRVSWAGYHVIYDSATAEKFTAGNLISADTWLPATGVPFTSGL